MNSGSGVEHGWLINISSILIRPSMISKYRIALVCFPAAFVCACVDTADVDWPCMAAGHAPQWPSLIIKITKSFETLDCNKC